MIKLIKNELYKMFHKKSTIIIFAISGFLIILAYVATNFAQNIFPQTYGSDYGFAVNSKNVMYESEKRDVDSIDPNTKNRDELYNYSWSLSVVQTYELIDKYVNSDVNNLVFYHIVEHIYPVIRDMNQAYYYEGDMAMYEEFKGEYDKLMANIDNYDWKMSLLERKEELLNEITETEELLKNNELPKEHESILMGLKYELEGINYRLEKNIPLSYSNMSKMVDNYVESAKSYASTQEMFDRTPDKDLSKYAILLQLKDNERNYNIFKYAIENDKELYDDNITNDTVLASNIANIFETSGFIDVFLIFFMLMIVSGILAEEFNKGTIKQLLLRPAKRTKILTSKIITCFISCIIFISFIFVLSSIVDIIKDGGIEGLKATILVYDYTSEQVLELSVFKYAFNMLLATLPKYLFYFGLTLCLSVITSNVAISLVASYLVPLIFEIVGLLVDSKISVYLPTSCYNLSDFLYGGISNNEYLSLTLSLLIDVVWILIFFVSTYIIFKKKDIKNQ